MEFIPLEKYRKRSLKKNKEARGQTQEDESPKNKKFKQNALDKTPNVRKVKEKPRPKVIDRKNVKNKFRETLIEKKKKTKINVKSKRKKGKVEEIGEKEDDDAIKKKEEEEEDNNEEESDEDHENPENEKEKNSDEEAFKKKCKELDEKRKNRLFLKLKKKIYSEGEIKELHPDIKGVIFPRKKKSRWCWAVFVSEERADEAMKQLKKNKDVFVNKPNPHEKVIMKQKEKLKTVLRKKEARKKLQKMWT